MPGTAECGASCVGEGRFGGLEPLHRYNLHFTEEFFALSWRQELLVNSWSDISGSGAGDFMCVG